jgi:UDP-glucose:(heptosyl)LPS alpha-1,3-glucosyltransferase
MFECARYLALRGHDVHVLANEWETDTCATITYHRVELPKAPWIFQASAYFRRCGHLVDRGAFDVVNTHGCICPTGGVHWVQSLHAAWLERARTYRPRFSWGRIRQTLNPAHKLILRMERLHFEARAYRKLIATTADVRKDLHDFYGVPEDDVVIVPNGFSPGEFSPAHRIERRDEMRKQLGLAPKHVAMLFVANELERKGYTTILSALKMLARPELRLLVVGRPDAKTVMRLAAAFGVGDQVLACGPTNDVSRFHAASDLFVLPTQYEAFCLAILEALGSGVPVLTTRVPGARDAIQPEVNGLLIDDPHGAEELAAALTRFLDADFRNLLASQAPASVTQYQWPVVMSAYEKILVEAARPSSLSMSARSVSECLH